jgi:hypothetical protein
MFTIDLHHRGEAWAACALADSPQEPKRDTNDRSIAILGHAVIVASTRPNETQFHGGAIAA